VSSPHTTYTPGTGATPEAEVSALANVYRFVLDCHQERGRLPDKSGPDDPERRSDEIRAKSSIP
jgi:hypothetical protein